MQATTSHTRYTNWDNINDAPMLSFEGESIEAKVVSVYDGDTVTAILD